MRDYTNWASFRRRLLTLTRLPYALVPKVQSPYRGYLFVAMQWDDSGEKPESLQHDLDGKGKVRHRLKAAWCAYPRVFRETGNFTAR